MHTHDAHYSERVVVVVTMFKYWKTAGAGVEETVHISSLTQQTEAAHI